jgi:hypothetical protein
VVQQRCVLNPAGEVDSAAQHHDEE